MYLCICVSMYVRTYTCMYVHMYIYMYVGMYARTYIFMYSQLCRPVYVRIYAVSTSVSQSVYLLRNAGSRITLAADLNYRRYFGITVIYFVYICILSVVFLSLHGQITVILNSTLDNECCNSKVISIQGKTKPLSIQDSILLLSFFCASYVM
jgi:hypothetical protein